MPNPQSQKYAEIKKLLRIIKTAKNDIYEDLKGRRADLEKAGTSLIHKQNEAILRANKIYKEQAPLINEETRDRDIENNCFFLNRGCEHSNDRGELCTNGRMLDCNYFSTQVETYLKEGKV